MSNKSGKVSGSHNTPSATKKAATPQQQQHAASSGSASVQKGKSKTNKPRAADADSDIRGSTASVNGGGAAASNASVPVYDVPIVLLIVEAPSGKQVKVETTPVDCVLDVRQFLMDCPETCELTAYHLGMTLPPAASRTANSPYHMRCVEHDGVVLNDYVELSEYPQLYDPAYASSTRSADGSTGSDVSVLKIVPDFYDERAARIHVRRLRDILVNPPAHVTHYTGVLTDKESAAAAGGAGRTKSGKASDAKSAASAAADKKADTKKDEKSGVAPDAKAADSKTAAAAEVVLVADEKKTLLANGASTALATTPDEKSQQLALEGEAEKIDFGVFTLTRFHEEKDSDRRREVVAECVRNINFSAWNPPPGNRQLRGDLLYLEVTTLEDHTLHVTASVDGFFLNNSTNNRFDPAPHSTPYKSQTLVELLRKASPGFFARFAKLLNRKTVQHPFEFLDVLRPVIAWNQPIITHKYDWNRAEDVLLSTYGMDSRGVIRDWNEEHASCRELPRVQLQERIMRDRTIYRVYSDFVDAATKGGVAIIHGSIPPINPMDPKKSFVYIYNNIFFSYAVDVLVPGTDTGDRQSYGQSAADVRGVAAYAGVDLPELYTLATTLVTYRGRRLIAQSIIPGIFHGDRASSHVYGSMDHGATVQCKDEFHTLIKKAADKLHIAEHKVADKNDKVFALAACVESKGLVGSDGRKYILDLLRVFPRDANFPDAKLHGDRVLRPELITLYSRQKAFEKLIAVRAKKEEEAKKAKADTKKSGDDKSDAKGAETKKSAAEKEKERESVAAGMGNGNEEDQTYIKALAEISFNPDVFTNAKLADSPEKQKADRDAVVEVSKYLLDNVIPKLVVDFKALEFSPLDAQSLTQAMHARGVNIRYLSNLARACADAKLYYIEDLCIQEMIVRTAKHILAEHMRAVKPDKAKHNDHWFLAPCIAHFLSSFLGPNCGGAGLTDEQLAAATLVLDKLSKNSAAAAQADEKLSAVTGAGGVVPVAAVLEKKAAKKKVEKVKLKDGRRAPDDPLAAVNLWQSVRNLCKTKFNYDLPERVSERTITPRTKLTMLRSLCRQIGVTVASRDYDLSGVRPTEPAFSAEDILELFPIVKANVPKSKDASDLLDAGKAYLAQGQLHLAYQYLNESLGLHNQVFGPMHADSAACYSALAMVCYHAMDYAQAVEHQQRAVVISERVLGLDHHDTAHAHSHLALFLHTLGHFEAALKHIRRALYLFELMCGPNHPDTAATHINIAMIYQDSGKIPLGLQHLQEALKRNRAALGDAHTQVALSHHAIAVAYGLCGAFRQALTHEKQAKAIYTAVHGPEHQLVQQSVYWLNQFTTGAVRHAKGGNNTAPDQNVLNLLSPLTWVSLRSSISFRGRLTMNDVLQLIETAAEREQHSLNNADAGLGGAADGFDGVAAATAAADAKSGAAKSTATVEVEDDDGDDGSGDDDDAAGGAGGDKTQRRKEKRKRQKKNKKVKARAEKEAAIESATLLAPSATIKSVPPVLPSKK